MQSTTWSTQPAMPTSDGKSPVLQHALKRAAVYLYFGELNSDELFGIGTKRVDQELARLVSNKQACHGS
jgi:hypothetical protein